MLNMKEKMQITKSKISGKLSTRNDLYHDSDYDDGDILL